MREYVPIILGAALICGFLGTLIAKAARKKSSYFLLYTSGALALATFIGVIASAAFLFLPEKQKADFTVPAIVFVEETGEEENTAVTFNGEWTYGNIAKRQKKFCGSIEIDSLDFTKAEDMWELELEFARTDDEGEIDTISSGFFYNSTEERLLGSGTLWTDRSGEKYIISILPAESEESYLIIAPAETVEEALELKKAFGFN